jgi:peptide chain release factor 2
MAQPDFWNDNESAQKVIGEANELKRWVEPLNRTGDAVQDCFDLIELAQSEEEAEELRPELESDIGRIDKEVRTLELGRMLGGKDDRSSAIVSINSGAGGTEACDWAEMLLRMYKYWVEQRGYKADIIDILSGDEAGIKSVTFIVKGDYAYGYLKAERGVHRLVRISPFDSNKRRHTSFASVDVTPEIADEIEIEINENDLRVDTYRSSGAGGQHVNVTDSAVRITHIPTGIVAQCQNERSQHKNRSTAMKILKARMYKQQVEEREKEFQKEYGEKADIAWGNQIRSYVFHPYNMVKDHRTNVETSNVQAVMDGSLDDFIEAYLKQFGGG